MLAQALKQALALVDVCVLDHFVVAGSRTVSFAERGIDLVRSLLLAASSGAAILSLASALRLSPACPFTSMFQQLCC